MEIALKLIGLFFGVMARTWIPYFRKIKKGTITKFEIKYLYQALGAVILALVSVLLIIPEYSIATGLLVDTATGIKLFATAFAFGFGWNSLVNEGTKWKKGGK